jgi:hypothetical protein
MLALPLILACSGNITSPGGRNGGSGGGDGAPSDEQFPDTLLAPYSGPPSDVYDNTFVGYMQLKGKVAAIFGDAWVRGGVDQFEANIGLLGGADFVSHFVEARVATSDFLLVLDSLSKDVCSAAVAAGSGPFAGLDLAAPVIDIPPSQTLVFQAEKASDMTGTGNGGVSGSEFGLYGVTAILSTTNPVHFPVTDQYDIVVRARSSPGVGAIAELHLGGPTVDSFTANPITAANHTSTLTVTAGDHALQIGFPNDGSDASGKDINLYIDSVTVIGPMSASTGTARETAARAGIDQLYRKMLFRRPTAAESDAGYGLLKDLVAIASAPEPQDAWSGVCEALIRHPDFLWTLPPSRPETSGTENETLLLVKVAQDLVARPPTDGEIQSFTGGGKTLEQLVDGWLASSEFQAYAYYKMRIRTESDGTPDSDEPARLWTRLLTTGNSYRDLLTGDYAVDTSFQKVARGPEHGPTGVLTMKGYIEHKPGLPHYNYSARVLSDYLGYVFEVPPEVIAMRIGATASSTVDPKSICFQCHQLLTPLAYQRSRWTDDGTYQTTDADGKPIDDSDHGLVPGYPYKGEGMAAFSTQAVKKERFVRQTLQAQFNLLFGRPMRFDQDERVLYKQLWDTLAATDGDLRASLKVMVASPQYQGK